jgi:hypothetical protein
VIRRKPLRARGKKKPTKAESAHIVAAKEGSCVPCVVRCAEGLLRVEAIATGCEYHHCKSGNLRRGHMHGFAACDWHHRGIPVEGLGEARTREIWGPALTDGSALFHRTYGSDDELIRLQVDMLTEAGK